MVKAAAKVNKKDKKVAAPKAEEHKAEAPVAEIEEAPAPKTSGISKAAGTKKPKASGGTATEVPQSETEEPQA